MSIYKVIPIIVALFFSVISAAGPIVISNSATKSLSSDDIKNVFLGKKSTLTTGEKVILATLANGEVHTTFMEQTLGKQPDQFSVYWKQLVFTGRGSMPKSFDTEQDLIDYVAKTKGAVGYVSAEKKSSLPANVNVIDIAK